MRVLLVCNYKPQRGGISGQVELLQRYLTLEGHRADIFSTRGSVAHRISIPPRLRRAAKGYDVVHVHCCSHWGFLPAVLGVSIGKALGKRVVLTYHGGGAARFLSRHGRLVRRVLGRADSIIMLNDHMRDIFLQYGIESTVVPNIIEQDTCTPHKRQSIGPRYICIRSHEEVYGLPCVLQAFAQVQRQLPEATLTLVGDGSQHEMLVQMANRLGLCNVRFVGRVPNGEVGRYLGEADVMVSAARVDNMPVSLLEAMRAGLLVVATRVGGVPDMIRDGVDGLLFEPDDCNALADKMLWPIRNRQQALQMVASAADAVQAYSWPQVKGKIMSAYGLADDN